MQTNFKRIQTFSATQLNSEDPIFDAAIDFDDLGDCGNAALSSQVIPNGETYQGKVDKFTSNLDYVFERLKLILVM